MTSTAAVNADGIITELNGKADKDLLNCSADAFYNLASVAQSAGKEVITNWGMPDYSSAETRIWATTYTEGEDGYVYMQTANIDDRGYHTLTIAYNGVTIEFDSRGSTTASEGFRYNLFIPVPKGASWNILGDSYGVTLYWIPLIGGV